MDNRRPTTPHLKTYLAIALVALIILMALILNLRNTLLKRRVNNQKTNAAQELQHISANLNQIFADLKKVKDTLMQTPTTTAKNIQNAAQISPDQLEAMISRLQIEVPTTTATTTPLSTSPAVE